MKHHTTLFIASIWIMFISLLAIPRGIKTILVILGSLLVFMVAYSMLQKKRRREAVTTTEPIETLINKTANEIVETIMRDDELIADAKHDSEHIMHEFTQTIDEMSTTKPIEHDSLAESLYRNVEPQRARRTRKKKDSESVTPHDESGFTI